MQDTLPLSLFNFIKFLLATSSSLLRSLLMVVLPSNMLPCYISSVNLLRILSVLASKSDEDVAQYWPLRNIVSNQLAVRLSYWPQFLEPHVQRNFVHLVCPRVLSLTARMLWKIALKAVLKSKHLATTDSSWSLEPHIFSEGSEVGCTWFAFRSLLSDPSHISVHRAWK